MGHLQLVVSTGTGAIVVIPSASGADPEAEARRVAREGIWSRYNRTYYPAQSIVSIHVTDSHEWEPEPRPLPRVVELDVVPSA